jgi:hypothetical protein
MYIGTMRHRPRTIVAAVYGAAVIAVVVGVSQPTGSVIMRLVIGICGVVDLALGTIIMVGLWGVAESIRERGLVHWVKPPWVSRSWAEQARHFTLVARVFGASFAIFGILLIVEAA